ncbi:MAG: hypothetical protein ACR2NZ_25305 [Rubripirellula sp.]
MSSLSDMSSTSEPDSPPSKFASDDVQASSIGGDSPRVAPTLKLSRIGLILSLLAMVGAGLGVYALFPDSVGGPPLPVNIRLERQPVETANGSGAVVTEVIVVANQTDHEIPKLSVDINGQYLLIRDSPLQPSESLVLPLRVFTDKRSSQRFNPDKYPVEDVTVTGQLPSRARGVTQFLFENGILVETK